MARMAATFHLDVSARFVGQAQVYRCDPGGPLPEYVVVSAVDSPYTGPETAIFAANADGTVEEWRELPGSFRGARDIRAALRDAGYDVSPPD